MRMAIDARAQVMKENWTFSLSGKQRSSETLTYVVDRKSFE